MTTTVQEVVSIEREVISSPKAGESFQEIRKNSGDAELSLETLLTLRSSREDEKDYLVSLNRRFAIVVEQNKRLERENEKLAQDVSYKFCVTALFCNKLLSKCPPTILLQLQMSETTRVKTITEVTQKQNEDSSKLREELASLKRSNLEKDSALERLTGELNDVTREYVPPNETNA
jgi:hypothetical protein